MTCSARSSAISALANDWRDPFTSRATPPLMSGSASIGFFDSGVGGLSVLRHALHGVDGKPLLYVADTAYAPYGRRVPQQIVDRCRRIAQFLIEQGAGAIVVACNTATAVAVDTLRSEFDIPIVGMEPALKPAARLTTSGQVAVLATQGTLHSHRYARLLSDHGDEIVVHDRICHGWVEAIEQGDLDSPRTLDLVNAALQPLHVIGVDTYVLGCTHYPFLQSAIRAVVGDRVRLIDPGPAVVTQLRRRLDLQIVGDTLSPVQLFSSGDPATLMDLATALVGLNAPCEPLPL